MQQTLVFTPTRPIHPMSFPLVEAVLAALAVLLLGLSGTLQMLGPDEARAAGIMGMTDHSLREGAS